MMIYEVGESTIFIIFLRISYLQYHQKHSSPYGKLCQKSHLRAILICLSSSFKMYNHRLLRVEINMYFIYYYYFQFHIRTCLTKFFKL